ncbi:hypothetical protein [Actinomadura chibensis]|uniref:Uncharacterized protein n=1 Tax=Actinomadura chibensis TaxID=392828 RepID=A0A5D0NDK4_9ACTN|nr:hypothetical protein [Actinomadura chibensis]TYB42442.1 hypothetical protein FXF69_32055 [Actinomadura chibensis]
MSSSDKPARELRRLVAELGDLAAAARAAPDGARPASPADLGALLTHAVRLYAACAENPYTPDALAELRLSPTEACVAAAALLHSQSLTPFEFAVWFNDSRVDAANRRDERERT